MIGFFDSGVGGLSVLRAVWQELPGQPVLYLADQAHVPYGPRPLEEVRRFSVEVSRFLIEQGANLVVVACNAASAAALHHLRQVFPTMPFVGMEPAVKPAAEQTHSRVVGVLATPATFQGALYASVVERFASDVTLLQDTCPGLVAQIEAGELTSLRTRAILEAALLPMLAKNIDTVVLGCTHYPFVIPLIQEIVGPQVRVIDPAPAVARQVHRLLVAQDSTSLAAQVLPLSSSIAKTQFLTSGSPRRMQAVLPVLLGCSAPVQKVSWKNGRLAIRRQPAQQASAG